MLDLPVRQSDIERIAIPREAFEDMTRAQREEVMGSIARFGEAGVLTYWCELRNELVIEPLSIRESVRIIDDGAIDV